MATNRSTVHGSDLDTVAGNGLLHRRMFLTAGTAAAAAVASATLPNPAAADALPVEPWMKVPGSGFVGYGQPSKFESKVARTFASVPGTTGTGAARTPHHLLDGMITPNGVHFERSHSGIPDINPDTHRLLIHGLVKRPLVFTLESLGRYPRESRVAFLECGGNGQLLYQKEPAPVGVQAIHGLVSCAEWTGVKLSVLLQEAGVDPKAKSRRCRRHEPQHSGGEGDRTMSPSECIILGSHEPISRTIWSTNWSKQSSKISLALRKLLRPQATPSCRTW
jgi:sulfane dehydrogenase subunit SoxC